MLRTNTLVWKTHRLANVAMQGDIQARKYGELVCTEPLNIQNLQEQDHSFVSGLAYYFQRYIMRDRRRCEDSKHESRATNHILLLFDFYISLPSSLSFGARSNSFLASTSSYLVVVS